MLDFYILEDGKPAPDYPEQADLEFAGDLDDKTFVNLQRKGVIGRGFDYYSDFRWNTELIRRVRQAADKQDGSDMDVQKLIALLDIAEANGAGLIAYGD